MNKLALFLHAGLLARAVLACLPALPIAAASAQHCPISYGNADAAKPNKLYLYFPTRKVPFEHFEDMGHLEPVSAFHVTGLPDCPATSTAELRDAIFNVVVETFCEFNVQVIQTTTAPPTTFPRRNIIAIGTEESPGPWGLADECDIGDAHAVNYARVWAKQYSHSPPTGIPGSTVEQWARSIGGTCAHEAGHGYGLDHPDGEVLSPGEDALEHHLMADGEKFQGEDRAARRHFSDYEYSILAANVGLSIQTMWKWDLVNPNAETASKLRVDFLSTQPSLILSWPYSGDRSPWANPTVTGPSGTTTFKGTTYKRYQIEWATGKSWKNGPAGLVPGGMGFHVGATFSSVNFSAPDPIIITNAVLLDENGNELELHPRLLGFDSGTLDVQDGVFSLRFFNTQRQPLSLRDLVFQQLPRVLSLDAMIPGEARMRDPHTIPFNAWPDGIQRLQESTTIPPNDGEYKVTLAHVGDKRHIYKEITEESSDEAEPDVAKPGSGISVDLFPATTVYVTGTVVDPEAKYWDPEKKSYVTGPLESRFYYQMAGRHPDLNKNGIDDYVEIATGKAKDTKVRGVPDDVEPKK